MRLNDSSNNNDASAIQQRCNSDKLFAVYIIRVVMEINWKVVAPIALVVGVIFVYFMRVKPIEGLENADKEFASKVKEKLAGMESSQKFSSEGRERVIKKLGTDDYKELLKKAISTMDTYLSTYKMETIERLILADPGNGQKAFETAVKFIDGQTKALDYARTSLSVLNGTDGQGSGMEATGSVDNSSGTSPSLW